jgi:hypothetical protein
MRVLGISLIVMAATLGQAHAEEATSAKPGETNSNCHYTVSEGKSIEVPVGANACVRSPPPYTDIYALLHCYPPLQDIDQVKRGDPRCTNTYGD